MGMHMRMNIDIDDQLLASAIKVTGQTTKKGAVEEALRRLLRLDAQKKAWEELRGMGWFGDLDELRGRK